MMNKKHKISFSIRVKNKLTRILQAHLFVSIVSLPILTHWGIPISAASIFGNIIFAPFLTIFLFVSSLIFFSEIASIPNQWLIILLEYITQAWNFFTGCGSNSWLIGFPLRSVILLWLIPTAAVIVLLNPKTIHPRKSIIFLSILFFSGIFLAKLIPVNSDKLQHFKVGRVNLYVGNIAKQSILVISGKNLSAPRIEYNVIPETIKRTGSTTIDHLIFTEQQKNLDEQITQFFQKTNVQNIYLANQTTSEKRPETKLESIKQEITIVLQNYKAILLPNNTITAMAMILKKNGKTVQTINNKKSFKKKKNVEKLNKNDRILISI